jgi:formyl-CoA transferase
VLSHAGRGARSSRQQQTYVNPNGCIFHPEGYINIDVAGEAIWQRLCGAIEQDDWLTGPRLETNPNRCDNRDELNALISDIMSKNPAPSG